MKKLTFILAACFCLLLASCEKECSCTYIIGHYVKSYSSSGGSLLGPDSDAAAVGKAFSEEIIAYDKAHESEWEWTVTAYNDDYSKIDEEALAKYKKTEAEIEAINNKYIEKFSKCTTDRYTLSEVHYVQLKRIASKNADLAYKEFSISYGE